VADCGRFNCQTVKMFERGKALQSAIKPPLGICDVSTSTVYLVKF